ncbi:MAG TPA: hypothetical protein VLU46_00330 [Thermoanaerobaculia bacterium]|nr:hypothetical protein [Thermoanaerobaculia bacterium]
MQPIAGCAILLAIVIVIAIVAAALIASMKRDARHGSGQLGNALQNMEGLFVESKEHILEAKRAEAEESDESGDPPEK